MSATVIKESKNFFVVTVKGVFTFEDLEKVQNTARVEIDRSEKIKLLILADQFTGWGKEGDWGDLTFMLEYDPYIEKIAVVSQDEWKDHLLMFLGAGIRKAAVEFFLAGAEEGARNWLQGDSD